MVSYAGGTGYCRRSAPYPALARQSKRDTFICEYFDVSCRVVVINSKSSQSDTHAERAEGRLGCRYSVVLARVSVLARRRRRRECRLPSGLGHGSPVWVLGVRLCAHLPTRSSRGASNISFHTNLYLPVLTPLQLRQASEASRSARALSRVASVSWIAHITEKRGPWASQRLTTRGGCHIGT